MFFQVSQILLSPSFPDVISSVLVAAERPQGLAAGAGICSRCGFGPFLSRSAFRTRNRIIAHLRVIVAEMNYRDLRVSRTRSVFDPSAERSQKNG